MKKSPLLTILIVLIVAVVIYSVAPAMQRFYQEMTSLEITTEEARRGRFNLIIDVRTPKEREELGFYPNSIPIAIQDLLKDVPFLIGSGLSSKNASIMVYSNGDRRAQAAAQMLYEHGYHRVRYLATTYDHIMPGRS